MCMCVHRITVYVYVCICMYVCMYVYVCVYVCMYDIVCECVYVCMYVCTAGSGVSHGEAVPAHPDIAEGEGSHLDERQGCH